MKHLGIFLSLLVFVTYFLTLSKGVDFGDSGEFITAVVTRGVAHSPGFPGYVLFANLFTKIPFGDLAWRVNLFSAVFGALSAYLIYSISYEILKYRMSSVAAVVLFSFSPLFWSQSVVSEVYTFMIFFILLQIRILQVWEKSNDNNFLYVFALICGLSLTNHILPIVFFPAYIYFIISAKNKLPEPKVIFLMTFIFIIGLLPYAHLPLTSLDQHFFNYGDMSKPKNFFRHITAYEYRARTSGISMQRFNIIPYAFRVLMNEFLLFAGLAIPGIFMIQKKNHRFVMLSLYATVGLLIFGFATASVITPVHFLPIMIFLSIFIAASINFFKEHTTKRLSILMFCIMLLFPVVTAYRSWDSVCMHCDDSASEYIDFVESELPQRSVFVTRGDEDFFPMVYAKIVEGRMPGVTLLYYKSLIGLDNSQVDTTNLYELSAVNKKVYQSLLSYLNQGKVFITTRKHEDTSNYSKEEFPLRQITEEDIRDILSQELLSDDDILFYKDY